MLNEHIEAIVKSTLFKGIDKKELGLVMNCLCPRVSDYRKNEHIVLTGDSFIGLGLVLQGEATVIKENSAGKRIMMTILKQGDLFGEMIAFSHYSDWLASVQAQSDCTVMYLPKEKIISQCEHSCPWHRKLIENMLAILSEKALQLNKKVEYLTMKSIREKICTFLLDQYKMTGRATFMLPMNRNELADFLNVSRPSLSREMCKLRDEGVIDFHLATVRILDVKTLQTCLE